MPKGVELGPRSTIAVGSGKNKKVLYSFMLKKVADHYGFKPPSKNPTRKRKDGTVVTVRGSVGNKHIKVPVSKTAKTKKGNRKYHQIPMPAGMTLEKIKTFLKKATKNKPEFFISDDGLQHSIQGK